MDDITFLILVRLDSIERLENILIVTEYISGLKFPILVLESSSFNNRILIKLLKKEVQYSFREDYDPILFRTKYLNQMVQSVKTPLIAVWDSDVIVSFDQIITAIQLLTNSEADFVIPYKKQALDTTPIIRKLFLEDGKLETLEQNRKKMKEMYAPNPLGGAFLANRESYIKAGMENEDFYGWGMEDGERFYRWQRLGYNIKRVPGPLYHLSHTRGINSTFHNPDQGLWKRKEALKAKRITGYGRDGIE